MLSLSIDLLPQLQILNFLPGAIIERRKQDDYENWPLIG